MAKTTSVLLAGLAFPEGPRWHDGRLWFSDMHAREVVAVDAQGKRELIVEVPNDPSGLGWDREGRLLVVSMRDRRLLRLDPDGLTEVANLFELAPHHCNDMLVDEHGRAYIGNFGFDLETGAPPTKTNLLLVTPDGEVHIAADDLEFPNGMVITPDGGTLVVGETFGRRLTAFDIAADGSLSGRRTWAQLEGIMPDGICLDAAGAIWVSSPISHAIFRVARGGEILEKIPLETQSFACMLGGPDGRTLHICTASSSSPVECRARRSGRIETVVVESPHAGQP